MELVPLIVRQRSSDSLFQGRLPQRSISIMAILCLSQLARFVPSRSTRGLPCPCFVIGLHQCHVHEMSMHYASHTDYDTGTEESNNSYSLFLRQL